MHAVRQTAEAIVARETPRVANGLDQLDEKGGGNGSLDTVPMPALASARDDIRQREGIESEWDNPKCARRVNTLDHHIGAVSFPATWVRDSTLTARSRSPKTGTEVPVFTRKRLILDKEPVLRTRLGPANQLAFRIVATYDTGARRTTVACYGMRFRRNSSRRWYRYAVN